MILSINIIFSLKLEGYIFNIYLLWKMNFLRIYFLNAARKIAGKSQRENLSATLSGISLIFTVQRPLVSLPLFLLSSMCRHYPSLPPYFSRSFSIFPSSLRFFSCLSCQQHVGVITLRRRILGKRGLLGERWWHPLKKS